MGITDYLAKGKGRNLASIGDLLQTVAVEDVKVKPAQGEGFGAAELPLIFSGEEVKVDNSVSKINGLVNEYIKTHGPGEGSLAYGSRQVPPLQARDRHAEDWCPR